MRTPRLSSEKVLGAAAIRRTRVATCAAKAPTNDDDSSQRTSVAIRRSTQRPQSTQRTTSLRLCELGVQSSRFQRRDDRRHDLEQVADDAVVGDLEDRRVGILVDRDDGAATPFMPTRCWIAPEMPSATYSFGATVWPELPTCRSIGSQPASQIGREAASSAPSASASCCGERQMFLPLDAAADRRRSARPATDRPPASPPGTAPRASAGSPTRRSSTSSARTGAGDAPLRRLIGAERADLERDEMRRRPLRHDVGGQLALEHRPHERRLAAAAS